ncbi:MAG: ABC transporter ATP-binding protein [Anaerolineales bacterium]|jgi:putative ABC transport system ATP-binding protein
MSINRDQNRHLIELVELTKVYVNPAGRFPALNGISLKLDAGEFISVVGKSGCGKTTLINMITGIDRPSSGEVFVAGVPVHELDEDHMAQWRGRNLGVIFQFFQLLPTLSIADNVMIPMDFCNTFPQRERYERALYLLELVDIAEHADKLPSEISGGQQQRAAIARALANDPPILAADEPTGNLDSKTGDAIFRLFETLVEAGKTLLVVTHDEELASRASRTIEMSDGVILYM